MSLTAPEFKMVERSRTCTAAQKA